MRLIFVCKRKVLIDEFLNRKIAACIVKRNSEWMSKEAYEKFTIE